MSLLGWASKEEKKAWLYWVFCAVMVLMSGCVVADALSGIERDKSGKVIRVNGNSIGETVFSTLGYLVPSLGWAGTAGTAAIREYRHWQIVKSGGKDDDRDGVPDGQVKST